MRRSPGSSLRSFYRYRGSKLCRVGKAKRAHRTPEQHRWWARRKRAPLPTLRSYLVDRLKHRGAADLFGGPHVRALAELAHLALARHRSLRHQRRDAKLFQRRGNLLHLLGAANPVARHAFEVVVDDLVPIERGIVVVQRGGDFLGYAGALRGEETFRGECLDALDHHAADHLQRSRGADFSRRDYATHVEFVDQQRHHGAGVRTGEQERRLVALRLDWREDRDVDITGGAFEHLRGLTLAAG